MRYGWNLAHGAGLVWNPGERVQGFTNLLTTLVMSAATGFFDKREAVLIMQLFGAGTILVIALLTMRITGIVSPSENSIQWTIKCILGFCCGLAYYPLIFWSLTGMETGLVAVFLLLSVLFALRYAEKPEWKFAVFLSISLGLAFLTRNDAGLFAVPIAVFLVWRNLHPPGMPSWKPHFLPALLIFFLFIAGQLGFQQLYYGDLLPNTYYLKLTGMPLAVRIQNGIGFLSPLFSEITVLLSLVLLEATLCFRKQYLLLLSFFLVAVGYQIYVGGDPWDYWRMIAPTIPLLMVLAVSAIFDIPGRVAGIIQAVLPAFQRISIAKTGLAILVSGVIYIGLSQANNRFLPEIIREQGAFMSDANRTNVNIALAIRDLTTPDATVGVLWAGAIPYYSGRKAVDFLGKTDPYIARLAPDISGCVGWNGMTSVPGHNKYDLHHSIVDLRPTYVQVFSWGCQDLTWASGKYRDVEYKGVILTFLANSPDVLWTKAH